VPVFATLGLAVLLASGNAIESDLAYQAVVRCIACTEQTLSCIGVLQVAPFVVATSGRVVSLGVLDRMVCLPLLALREVLDVEGHCVSGFDGSGERVRHIVIKCRRVCPPSLVLWCRRVSLDRSI